ncbi:DUF397 domain-containing protein [Streptomyces sp. NPDC059569]|uniref:DUF397 domain-containing protein n=1 Tax=Streptomyces sp. NPDC059569 TaxID=3346869 RepID=UPI0036CECD84
MNPNPAPSAWVKSSYSTYEGGNCVEWSPSHAHAHNLVPIRDSKAPHHPHFTVTPHAWTDFVAFATTHATAYADAGQ